MPTDASSKLDTDEIIALTKWHIEQKQLDKALITIKPILSAKKPNEEANLLAARLYAQLQLFEKAQTLFTNYLAKNPDASHIQFQLGMTQYDSNNNKESISTWSTILKEQPYNPPALFYSALAHLKEGNQEQAITMLQTILTQIPTDNLYFGKAKELISDLERDPAFRGAANKVNAAGSNLTNKDIYSTEH